MYLIKDGLKHYYVSEFESTENQKEAAVFRTKKEAEAKVKYLGYGRVVEQTFEINFTKKEIEILNVVLGNLPGFPAEIWLKINDNIKTTENIDIDTDCWRSVLADYVRKCKEKVIFNV